MRFWRELSRIASPIRVAKKLGLKHGYTRSILSVGCKKWEEEVKKDLVEELEKFLSSLKGGNSL